MIREEKRVASFHSSKHHSSNSWIAGGSGAFFSLGMIALFMLTSLWLLLRPYRQSDLLLPSTVNHHRNAFNIVNKVKEDPMVYNTVHKNKGDSTPSTIDHHSSAYNIVNEIKKDAKVYKTVNKIKEDSTPSTIDHSSVYNIVNEIKKDAKVSKAVNKIKEDPIRYNKLDEIKANLSAPPVFCDLSRGEWLPDSSAPLYTNDTCKYINPSRDCLLNGRPDRGYLHWRWKPSDCELPRFDASYFLELLSGKRLAFIGDSLARDHGQSLVCALTQVEDPDPKEGKLGWFFPSYNFTMVILWSPFLVQNSIEQFSEDHDDLFRLDLDVPEEAWASELQEYDIAIISTGYWHFRRSVYYSNNTVLGGSTHSKLNVTTFDMLTAFRMAMGTALRYMATKYGGVTMLRTVTVDHFEHGVWNAGGKCNRTHPFPPQQYGVLPWINNAMNRIQVEEFEKAAALANISSKLTLLNVTYSAYLRPDGHPSIYRNLQPGEPANDCLHWCLPGPVDMWNQLILHTLQPIYTRSPII